MVDGRQVSYERVPDKFAYDFRFCCGETQEEAIATTKHLASIMCYQSYDHGQEWRVTAIEPVDQEELNSGKKITWNIKIGFKIWRTCYKIVRKK